MTDTISKEKRSETMSKIRGKDTKIEIQVRHWLHHHGIRYRKHCKDIAGSPDISIKKHKIAIFVHGCFWHGHEYCEISHIPKTRVEYWKNKIEKNKTRDRVNFEILINTGWHVFVVWECQLKFDFDRAMKNLLDNILLIKKI